MNRRLEIKWDTELAITVLFFGPQLNYYIAALLSMNGLQTATMYIYAVLFVVGLISYAKTIQCKRSFCFITLTVVLLFLSSMMNSKVNQFMFTESIFASPVIILMFVYVPVFMMFLGWVDYNSLLRYFRCASYLVIITALASFGGYLFVRKTTPPDYMSFAYMMLTPIIVCFINGTEGKILDFILSIIGIFIVFIVGCRGAVVTLAGFLLLYVIGFYLPREGQAIGKILLIFLILTVIVFSDSILNMISLGLQAIGFTSRTVNKLLRGGGAFIESEGRRGIWSQALSSIDIFGKGLFGDRTVIIDEFGNQIYAHNFILELLIDFGAVIGALLIVLFIITVVKSVKSSADSKSSILLKISFAMVAILAGKHMISTSFLTSVDFWFYMGFILNTVIYRDALSEQFDEAGVK